MAENGDRLWPTDKEVAGLSNENRNATIQNAINTYKDNVSKLIDAESEEFDYIIFISVYRILYSSIKHL